MKTLILMQSATFLQVIATWAEKVKARQPKMLLKTSINVLSKNEEIKSQRAGPRSHAPGLAVPSNTDLYDWDLSSSEGLGLASEFGRRRGKTGVV